MHIHLITSIKWTNCLKTQNSNVTRDEIDDTKCPITIKSIELTIKRLLKIGSPGPVSFTGESVF